MLIPRKTFGRTLGSPIIKLLGTSMRMKGMKKIHKAVL